MAYAPTTWVEKATKVGPTNLNKLELGLQSAAAVADAANTLAAAAFQTPAGSDGQFLQRVGGLWVPHTLVAADMPSGIAISKLADPGSGNVIGSLGAGAVALKPPGTELNYTQIVATANITDLAEATATALISPGAIAFDGTAVIVEFYCAHVPLPTNAAGGFVIICLFEGATEITRLAVLQTSAVTAQEVKPIYARYRFTPTNASHTYKITAFTSSTTGTPSLVAGAGGTATPPPAFVRFTKA